MGFLGKDQLLKKQKLLIEKVDLGNGDFVYVREMTARENDAYSVSLLADDETGQKNMVDFRARMAVYTLCDKEGRNIFEIEDIEKLSTKTSGNRMKLIVTAASRLNKITEEEDEKIVKNSEAAQSGNSISDSVEN